MEIGFIGLGAMGRAMASRLLSAGHRLRVWNRSPGPARDLADEGAQAVGTPAEAFRGDVAITMLADDGAYRSIGLAGPVLDQAPRGMIHLNMATVSVELTRELAAAHTERGLPYVAAPVFGRAEVAAAGKLTIVAAGPEEALDRAAPLLDAMGQRTWRLGPEPTQAAATKIAGNFMIAAAIETISEATTLAARHGVAPETLLDLLTSSLFAAPVYKNYGAIIAGRKYQPAGVRLA
jgi:3-hydroxyisobutyrate dehydrogenase-like beta-hydroxyacid dehydrogenase